MMAAPRNVLSAHKWLRRLHRDVGLLTALANVVNRVDIRMVQGRSGASLKTKTFECLRVMANVIGQEFESDEPAQFDVLGLVNDAHATTALLFDNAVARDGLTDHSTVFGLRIASSYGYPPASQRMTALTPGLSA
jgi:hypothetical protein